jgi:ferritin
MRYQDLNCKNQGIVEQYGGSPTFFHPRAGDEAEFPAIEAPKAKWSSPWQVFEETHAHEQKGTGMKNASIEFAIAEKDRATFEIFQ